MKRNTLLILAILLVAFGFYNVHAQQLKIEQDEVELIVGDSTQVTAVYTDADDNPVEVDMTWSVEPEERGTINNDGWFYAAAEGTGYIYAGYDNLVDSVKVKVEEKDDDGQDDKDKDLPRIVITPEEVELLPGETQQLTAIYIDANGDTVDVAFDWMVVPGFMGSIDESLVFTAEHPGKGEIFAKFQGTEGVIKLKVEEEDKDDDDDKDGPRVKIVTERVKLVPADSVQLLAVFMDSSGAEVDTTITWSVEPPTIGHFDDPESGLFFADDIGKGKIFARVGELSDKIEVEIDKDDDKDDDGKSDEKPIVIAPQDTVVNVGDVVQFSAAWSSEEKTEELNVQWSLKGDPVGTISETGEFLAVSPGVAIVKAKADPHEVTTTITVVDPASADAKVNTVTVFRVLPDGHVLPHQTVEEGGVYKIGGMPYPLNVLNGGRLHFPSGSLHEDINIHILLPDHIKVDDDSVSSEDGSVAAIRFVVSVGDSAIEPYYFDKALNVAIPFKRGLLKELGLDPKDLGLFFAENSGFTNVGISNVIVDSSANKIYAQVIHFSTLVVRDKSTVTGLEHEIMTAPDMFVLEQNYPNPFNPNTTIRYQLNQSGHARVVVHDNLGRLITTLVDREVSQGSHQVVWDGRNAQGLPVASGIYFYSLRLNDDYTVTKKMLLVK